jgi:phosphoribosylformimino-5-aminoimidazole carboxamide ribotide isomerase
MQLIPVLDLMGGQVVRGVAGERRAYQPVASLLADEPTPDAVARGFCESLGLREAYVADLDAIGGGEPDWEAFHAIAATSMRFWLDAGLRNAEAARRLIDFDPGGETLSGVIAGLETLSDLRTLSSMVEVVGSDRLVFSLDLKAGIPLSEAPAWQNKSAVQIAQLAVSVGVRRMIVLDLAQVGVGEGVGTESICRTLRKRWPAVHLTAGGGVRNFTDVQSLSEAGCDAALVASALHDGRIGPAQLARLRQL